MKKILILFAMVPMLSNAQEAATIKTIGRALFKDPAPKFMGATLISASFANHQGEPTDLPNLMSKYDEALKRNGLSLAQLEENKLRYDLLGYKEQGTMYIYETTSIGNLQKFLVSHSYGAQRSDFGYTIVFDTPKAAELAREAIDNARRKADAIAKKMGSLLGPIVSVEDNNSPDIPIDRALYNDNKVGEYEYDVTVVFALK
ncbi:MAG: SIMPL domain-containing protein [Flavobacteriaceae bacterium]